MINSYIKIAFRNLWRYKIFSFINITGLAVGIAACFLIFLYVEFELSYDSFNSKTDRIYRLVTDIKSPSDLMQLGSSSPPMAINIQKEFPEVESVVRISSQTFTVQKGTLKFEEPNSLLADSALFNIFDFPLKYGDKNTALKEPMSIVLSETAAKKYFGNINPVGQTVLLNDRKLNANIMGVMKDIPENAQFKADMIVSMSSQPVLYSQSSDNQWTNFGVISYLLLKANANSKAVESKFPAFINAQIGEGLKEQKTSFILHLEPLRDIYLKSERRDGVETGSLTNVYIFSIIAVFILLIACVNFINLTTARSTERAKEVGIRKVAGALRSQLAKQFIYETIVLVLIAFCIAVLLCVLLLPLFNQLAGKQVCSSVFLHPYYILYLFLISIGIGVIAGFYPSIILSSFQPMAVLKGQFASGKKGLVLRKGLVIFQFTISVILIVSTVVIYNQVSYMRNYDLGFSKDQMMIIDTKGDKHKNTFKESLSSIAGVRVASFSNGIPGMGNLITGSKVENQAGNMQSANLDLYLIDYSFINQYKMSIVAGRAFSKDFSTDSTQAMVINESAVKLFGYTSPKGAIGNNFEQWGRKGKIIGVVKDFHFTSLQEPVKPLSMLVSNDDNQSLSIKVSPVNLVATISAIQNSFVKILPDLTFKYSFLDEDFDRQYRAESKFGSLFLIFAVLAIFISSLGLLGLTAYSTIQRRKEIGIRKLLGASVTGIVHLLSMFFLKLVFIACVVAFPLSYWLMHKWLQNFAYRIDINWQVFLVAGVCISMISFLTISFQTIKSAITNPVKNLRVD
jgi:putative ABC transport system permease protein